MGKQLIIKGADFSANAVDVGNWTDLSDTIVVNTSSARQYIHYPNNNLNDAYQYVSGSLANTRIAYAPVSSYVGKTLRLITSSRALPSAYSGGAWWIAFASEVTSLPWTATTTKQNAITAVERIAGKGTGTAITTWLVKVPMGATHLVFNIDTTKTYSLAVEAE